MSVPGGTCVTGPVCTQPSPAPLSLSRGKLQGQRAQSRSLETVIELGYVLAPLGSTCGMGGSREPRTLQALHCEVMAMVVSKALATHLHLQTQSPLQHNISVITQF